MKTSFGLTFNERDDGVKVWSAECQRCGKVIVGERNHPVTVVSVDGHVSPVDFARLKEQLTRAWDRAQQDGRPIIHDKSVTIKTHDSGTMQQALDAHADTCGSEIPTAA
jgi:hypothetical protein